MIKIELDDHHVSEKLKHIVVQLKRPRKLYGVLGEQLKKIHNNRFKQEKSPDGEKWQPLSPLTRQVKGNDHILKDSHQLRNTLAYNYSDQGVEFGSALKYARLHQFGGTIVPKKAKRLRLGKSSVYAKKVTIPARPWLGISKQDEPLLLRKAHRVLESQIQQVLK
ncbi:phage virion morphogenesis protein [Pasteurellaceae bacterium HPA106]|uniref:phage virion morphogenesis protein n=1 Tax=Spirabiliibacterium pneumoniae TaxID=221400 RepID=UPI001AAC5425|nr:phage virion morphogenesis protein [Spirabiliibacterium pneumoniae]MBE2896746.1 phage virion morphogenesis protein [Spirabiliibacterium pneumoniae]